jgi:A/G-specific adenine glycosylase
MTRLNAASSTTETHTQMKPAMLRTVHAALHAWYHVHGRRDLPWRNTRDAYAIWLSEIMLQQTQVKSVLERYYPQFLTRFPSLASLAAASQEVVIKQWEGLGYYTRARNLHKTAQLCVSSHNGHIPDDLTSLLALPGIGRNTAHAILAFAYYEPYPVMEANVKRVLARVYALTSASDALLWQLAIEMLDKNNPFDYNQAMMDVGAMVCTPRAPSCSLCPLACACRGKASPELFPTRAKKKAAPTRQRVIVAWRNAKDNYLLTPRTSQFLHGLYGFTEYTEIPPNETLTPLGEITQIYSHFRLEASVYAADASLNDSLPDGVWVAPADFTTLPLSRADSKVAALVRDAISTSGQNKVQKRRANTGRKH